MSSHFHFLLEPDTNEMMFFGPRNQWDTKIMFSWRLKPLRYIFSFTQWRQCWLLFPAFCNWHSLAIFNLLRSKHAVEKWKNCDNFAFFQILSFPLWYRCLQKLQKLPMKWHQINQINTSAFSTSDYSKKTCFRSILLKLSIKQTVVGQTRFSFSNLFSF